ncbi:MAG: hypothetical protein PHO91_04605 [Patescibacteria group bacterium]|nr:hypothetical protein [Patescibacteria group bacterium]
MGNFNRDRNNRDRGRRGNDRGFNRRDSGRGFSRGGGSFGRPEMHSAVCDQCGQNCEVPFRPTGDKPIYCSSCFEKKGGRGSDRPTSRFASDRPQRPSFVDRGSSQPESQSKEKEILKAIKTLNYKVDQLMKVLVPESANQGAEVVASEVPTKTEVGKAKVSQKKTTVKKPSNKKPAVKKASKKTKISKK